jgi:hypothetical protein
LIWYGQIYGPGLGRHDPMKARRGLGAGLSHCFYTSGGHDTAQKLFGLSLPESVWYEAWWAWTGLARPGPISSTSYGVLQNQVSLNPQPDRSTGVSAYQVAVESPEATDGALNEACMALQLTISIQPWPQHDEVIAAFFFLGAQLQWIKHLISSLSSVRVISDDPKSKHPISSLSAPPAKQSSHLKFPFRSCRKEHSVWPLE